MLNILIAEECYVLAFIGAITSVVSSFYYVNLIKILFFEEYTPQSNITQDYRGFIGLLSCVLFFTVFVYPLAPGFVNDYFLDFVSCLVAPTVG